MEFSAVNTIWVLLGAALVFFMQAGFAMVETGFTRAKNAGNIIMKNLMDFAIGTPLFWLTGFGIMFGGAGAFIGGFDPLVRGDYSGILPAGVPLPAYLIFQTVFCATAATIVSGAMAERTKFISYCIYSAVISAVVYPVSGHWIWGGGWLARMGFHDFAGSTAVHMCGGAAALIGAKVLGPRIGKYTEDGKPNAILGHSLTLGALGVFILWFCWFGFNGCSTVAMDSDAAVYSAGNIFVTTNLAAATATAATMVITWLRYGKPDISMTLNGSLAGLVAITAGCDMVSPAGAFFIGLIAAFVVVFGIEFIDKVCKIDDPVGAIGVHGMCGAAGTLLTGVFAVDGGLVYGGGFSFLGIQLLGVVCVILWVSVTMIITFNVLKHTIGLRASEEEETKGLDVTEHNLASSYADFMPMVFMGKAKEGAADAGVSVEKAVPVEHYPSAKPVSANVKLSKVVMIFNQARFTALKDALTDLGVTGMTITQVMGCGTQKGHVNYYRGIKVEEAALLPKMKLEVVVSKVPVEDVIETARKALYTGNIGDGKIFVYDVENVVKVRTGEQGYDALQGE
ncbi:adenylate cyclase [Enterocloster clostridioformis]|uniref:ammonium transporter n=1 Tax=Enterocloster clostridioformis TaxID=1531 RepID=UPI00080C6962|nr:ammonium transporter [Enterocloster clostridioformis]ANU44599.1 adenylate cyclase [Lachnoclostridium sp. YL32]NDO28037.1 ammonium transporter [Enterocloster clostridioformis]OXE70491.1 adenylate cyclase [Enterocloster clostridioformis]QQR00645.1 ammonium transporter [Enterocloster clostridioformis]